MAGQQIRQNDRGLRPLGRRRALHPALGIAALMVPLGAQAQTTLPDINVIATTPLSGTRSPQRSAPVAPSRPAPARAVRAAPGPRADGSSRPLGGTCACACASPPAPADPSMIERDKVPSNTQVLTSADFSHDRSTSFLEGLGQYLPGVFIGDQSGNQFQRDVNYRGFSASPVPGTPQGLAVYQNGVRINEFLWRYRQLGLHPGNGDPPPFARAQQPDLRPQCHRRCPHHRDEERLHLSGQGGRGDDRLLWPPAGRRPGRISGRQSVGLYQRRRHKRRRVEGLLLSLAVAADVRGCRWSQRYDRGSSRLYRRRQQARRGRRDPDRDALAALVERLHVAADHAPPARIRQRHRQLRALRHAVVPEQRLLSRILGGPCGRQRHRWTALRSDERACRTALHRRRLDPDQRELSGGQSPFAQCVPRRDRPQLDLHEQLRRHRPGHELRQIPRPRQSLRRGDEHRSRPHAVHRLEPARHRRPEPVRARDRRLHRPAGRRYRAGQPVREEHLYRRLRDRHH